MTPKEHRHTETKTPDKIDPAPAAVGEAEVESPLMKLGRQMDEVRTTLEQFGYRVGLDMGSVLQRVSAIEDCLVAAQILPRPTPTPTTELATDPASSSPG